MKTDQFMEELFSNNTVFRDEAVFSLDYVPEALPHREEQLRELITYFKHVVQNPFGYHQSVILEGPVGSGKTALARRFGLMVEDFQKKNEPTAPNAIRYVHVNVRKHRTVSLILTQILSQFIPFFPLRGYSSQELLLQFKEIVKKQCLHVILSLDEVDYLFREQETGKKEKENDLLYTLTRMNEDSSEMNGRVSLLLATRDPKFRSYLDESTCSSLSRNRVFLASYEEPQLEDILSLRVEEGFVDGTVDKEVILLTAKVATKANGDARYALDLIWRAGKKADQERSSVVKCDHVRQAQLAVIQFHRGLLATLQSQERAALLAVCRALEETQTAAISSNILEKYLQTVRESFQMEIPTILELPRVLKRLSDIDLLAVEKETPGEESKVSLLDTPISLLKTTLLDQNNSSSTLP
ncbi:MAG: Cdc6/Cdc18 family protein [Candidatus Hodarchaeota archaeon]